MTPTTTPQSTMSRDRLLEVFDYNYFSGLFTRKVAVARRSNVGDVITSIRNGYIALCMDGKTYAGHRAAWLYVFGEMPSGDLDHINGDKQDNRISNLRIVNSIENGRNSKRYSTNKSGITGVCWHKNSKRWAASITNNGKQIHLGYFDTALEAGKARAAAEGSMGFHRNHGRVL